MAHNGVHWRRVMLLVAASMLGGTAVAAEEFTPPPIRVPTGFTVELAAAPPLVQHPMLACFDDRGRMFIAESAGLNLPRVELEQQLPNFIRLIEDTDGDGRFDKSTIFCDRMTMPQGALWHRGALYVASPPSIWRLEDTDGDGVADRRDEIVNRFGYTGNAADIHGCFLGPDGRIFWCDGRHGHEFQDAEGRAISKGLAARIFSCRLDGSDVRVHCGGGMDNPVEIDFMPTGEMLGTVNLFYRTRGDCLVHWMHGGVYPRFDQPQCIAEFKSTGPLLEPVIDLGHVAVSGTTRYRGGGWGEAFRDNFFITQFNTHQVVRATLTRDGSTFRAAASEFFTADSADFHPTDVLQDADGSLLVIDTGGWFRIGCPTSQIAKPNILGAIYRVRRTDATPPVDPRGRQIRWAELTSAEICQRLNDERFSVAEQAIEQLALRGAAAIEPLRQTLRAGDAAERRAAVWALTRIGSAPAQAAVRETLDDADPEVRVAAAFSAGSTGDREAITKLRQRLLDEQPFVRREAATALGKLHAVEAVADLLSAVGQAPDRVLEHALIFALIEINSATPTASGLADPQPAVRRAALLAWDQMTDGNLVLTREAVAGQLATSDFALKQTALDILARHPQWSGEIASYLAELFGQATLTESQQASGRGLIAAFAGDEKVSRVAASALGRSDSPTAVKRLILEGLGRSGLSQPGEIWLAPLQAALTTTGEAALVRDAIAAIGMMEVEPLRDVLLSVARDTRQPVDNRIDALRVATRGGRTIDEALFMLLATQIEDDSAPAMQRLTAAQAIGAAHLSDAQLARIVRLVEHARPLEIHALLAPFAKENAAYAAELFAALERWPARSSLSAELLKTVTDKQPPAVRAAAAGLTQKLQAEEQDRAAQLADWESSLNDGDPQRGQAIFRSKTAACITCHRTGNEGGQIGPDLSTVASRRTRRDLLEAIVFPSASLARGFETYQVATRDGRVISGMLAHEGADAIFLRTVEQHEIRVPRDEIDDLQPAKISIMPAGLEKSMTREQLQDLLAYLQSLRAATQSE